MRKFGVLMIIVLVLSAILVPAAIAGGKPGAGSGCPPVYYRIVRGDNLTMIASRYGVSVWQVARWNGISNIDRIYVGSVLVIYPARCHKPAPPPPPRPPIVHPVPPIWPPAPPIPPIVQPVPPIWPPVPPIPPVNPCATGACCSQSVMIASPTNGARIAGMATITGNAVHDNFKFYKLEYGAGSNPTSWHWFFGGNNQVWRGTLGVLNTDVLPNGIYTIRLTVVDNTSNYPPPCQVTVQVR